MIFGALLKSIMLGFWSIIASCINLSGQRDKLYKYFPSMYLADETHTYKRCRDPLIIFFLLAALLKNLPIMHA